MSEPKVEFDLNNMQTQNIELLKILDEMRRWFGFREDRKTPAMVTFEGELIGDAQINLYVPGKVYGYSGMSQITGDFWVPMTYSPGVQNNVCYFALETENTENNFVTVRLNSVNNNDSKQFKATVFYIGETDAN